MLINTYLVIKKKLCHKHQNIFAQPYLSQHYSQQPRGGSNPNVHWQVNGERIYDIYTYSETLCGLKKKEVMSHAVTWGEP